MASVNKQSLREEFETLKERFAQQVKQKVSGCFRKAQCAQAYCRISSYLQTMANRGHNPLVAIQLALSGQLYAQAGE